jgi:acyl carrier protein phosphodiesterase
MIMMRKTITTSICICVISFTFIGCAKSDKHKKDTVVATINNEPLYAKDLKRNIALNLKSNPRFKITPQTLNRHIDIMIDKGLLIQEAKKQKLDETERFVNTIKAFWEQTLIRDLIEYKSKDLAKTVTVTDEEARNVYDKLQQPAKSFDEMKQEIEQKLKNQKIQKLFQEWLADVRKKSKIDINDNILKDISKEYER